MDRFFWTFADVHVFVVAVIFDNWDSEKVDGFYTIGATSDSDFIKRF